MARLHISASPETLAYLHAKAAELNCSERRLGSALIACIARDDMAAAILDGEWPKDIVPSGRRSDAGTGPFQDRLLRAMGARAGDDGTALASLGQLAETLKVSKPMIVQALRALCAAGRLVLVERGRPHHPAVYRLNGPSRATAGGPVCDGEALS